MQLPLPTSPGPLVHTALENKRSTGRRNVVGGNQIDIDNQQSIIYK